MSPPVTLARRFRSQRTDRIRLVGDEVFSKVEFMIEGPSVIEIAFESCRADCAEGLALYSPAAPLTVTGTDLHVPAPSWQETSLLSLVLPPESIVQLACDAPREVPVTIWNIWMHEGTEHAWTGNSGIMIERFDPPSGAEAQRRLWCSDGLGDPSFDDLVAVVTLGRE